MLVALSVQEEAPAAVRPAIIADPPREADIAEPVEPFARNALAPGCGDELAHWLQAR